MAETRSQSKESQLDKLKETIDDKNAQIGERIHALLLLLRSRKAEEENLHVHACPASSQVIPTSLQLPESPDFNRPDPKPNYVINATADVTKASSPLPNRTIKCHRRISLEEIEERRLKGLCLFCEESETPHHYLLHKNSGILMIDCDEDQFEHRTEKLVPEAQEQVVMNENLGQEWVQKNFTKGFDVKGDVERGQKGLSMEKVCCAHKVFAKMSQHKETLGIKKKQKGLKFWRFKFKHRVAPRDSKSGFEVKMKQNPSKEYPYKMLLEGRFEVPTSTDLWLSKERGSPPEIAIDCELEAGEIDTTIDQNQLIQEEAKNHSTGLVHETSLLRHKSSLLKHQVSISHWEFSHRSPIESLDVYDDWPSAIMRTHRSQSNFDLEYAASNAYQVCDSISLGTKLLTNGKRKTFLKAWRFKFKEQVQPRQLIQEKLGVHEANATKNQLRSPTGLVVDDLHGCGSDIFCVQYFVSSVVAGDFQKTQWLFNDELQDIKKFQIVIEEDSNSYVYQEFNGMRIRSHMLHHQRKPSKSPKSWKFKFKSENLRKMEVKVLDNREVVVGVVGIRQVTSVTKPVTIKQQRGFLDLSGYYRRFVQHFGSIASLLYALSKKDNFIWSLQAQEVFNKLKLALYQAPILALPLFDRPLIVETEAYGNGIGVVFMQDGHPIEYNSRQANSTQLPTILQDTMVKEPELVLDRKMVNRQGKTATKVLVKWTNETIEEATWEVLFDLQKRFPTFEP